MSASLRCYVVCATAAVLSGCAGWEMSGPQSRPAARYRQQHEAFRAQEGWRKLTYRQTDLLARATATNTTVEISLTDQRGLLLVHGSVALDFPVATGKASHPTPPGSYRILEKKKEHASNLYGRILSATGETTDSDADARTDAVPEGGSFVGAPMPYWMHVGHVPGRPASHGCIRLKRDAAVELFGILEVGSPVTVGSGVVRRNSG
jgi:lipoprotein-anchoring transpeptidase ErfK/SrfK